MKNNDNKRTLQSRWKRKTLKKDKKARYIAHFSLLCKEPVSYFSLHQQLIKNIQCKIHYHKQLVKGQLRL